MKKISIMVPCYNEEENVIQMHDALTELFRTKLEAYDYEFLFIDNKSTDRTRELLRQICGKDQKTKAIFNMKNFGQFTTGSPRRAGTVLFRSAVTFRIPWN